METKKLLELRKAIKSKKPKFLRQEALRRKRLGNKWRKSRGIHSKSRLEKKGKRANVKPGYGSPRQVKGLDRSGMRSIIISNISDLNKLDGSCIAVIKSSVGKRKRLNIVNAATEAGIKISNVPDTKAYAEKIAVELSERKSRREKLKGKKIVNVKKELKKKEEKEVVKSEKTEEKAKTAEDVVQQKEKDRLEAEKVMIKK